MKKLLFLLPLLPSLLLADISAEKLAEIRQQSLEQAVEFHKGKNPSTSQLLQTAREFEDYLLNQKPVSKSVAVKKYHKWKRSPPTMPAPTKGVIRLRKPVTLKVCL